MGQWLINQWVPNSTECWWDIPSSKRLLQGVNDWVQNADETFPSSIQRNHRLNLQKICALRRFNDWCWLPGELAHHFLLQPLLKLPKDSINDFWMNGKECWQWVWTRSFLINSKIIRIETKGDDDDYDCGGHTTTGNCRALTGWGQLGEGNWVRATGWG